jgi:hypothetical protein
VCVKNDSCHSDENAAPDSRWRCCNVWYNSVTLFPSGALGATSRSPRQATSARVFSSFCPNVLCVSTQWSFYVEGERASGTRQVGEVGEVGVCRALNPWSQC